MCLENKDSSYLPIVSYFLITVLTSIALKSGTDKLQFIIAKEGLILSTIWAVPLAFFLTLFRFFIGNLWFMKITEQSKPKLIFWGLNISVITIEMFFFILASAFIYEMQQYFLTFISIILILDAIWAFYILGSSKNLKKGSSVILFWAKANILTVAAIIIITYYFGLIDLTLSLISYLLIGAAIGDFIMMTFIFQRTDISEPKKTPQNSNL